MTEPLKIERTESGVEYARFVDGDGLRYAVAEVEHAVARLMKPHAAGSGTRSLGRRMRDLEHEVSKIVAARSRLARGIVANAGRHSRHRKPRWAHVVDATSFGSTSAQALCVEQGFDPDEMIGGEK